MTPALGRRLAGGLLITTLVTYAIGAALGQVTASVDLWWHLATGRYIVAHREIPRYDVFSYTQEGARWINPEWLADVLLFGLWQRGGETALLVFKVLVTVAFLALAVRVALRRSGSPALSVAVALVAAVLCRVYLDLRPDLFLFLGTMTVVALIDVYRRGAPPAVLLLLPAVMILWVNVHGSFLFGLGVIGLYAGGELLKAYLRLPDAPLSSGRAWWLALAAAASAVACLLNPEGLAAFTFGVTLLAPEAAIWRTQVVEWLPPVLFRSGDFNPPLFGYFLVAEVLATIAALVLAARRVDVSDTLLTAVTAVMALRARRFIPLFAVVSVPFLAKNLAVVGARLAPRRTDRSRTLAAAGTVALAVLALVALGVRALPEIRGMRRDGAFDYVVDASFFPRPAVEFLRLNPIPARLFHLYAWGGYLIFQLPDRKVFIDPRGHTVYPAAFYRRHTEAEFGAPAWKDVLDRERVDLVLWPTAAAAGGRGALLGQLFASHSWRRIYDDGDAVVLAHVERGRPWLERYDAFGLAYPETARAQFFLGLARVDAGDFERGRQILVEVVRRFPDGDSVVGDAAERAAIVAAGGAQPLASFALGFYRDVRGDRQGAEAAYRAALDGGIPEPYAAWIRTALAGRPAASATPGRAPAP